MEEVRIEKLRQIISRTDKSGNEKVELILYLINQHEISRFQIDFNGNVLCGIEISNNQPKVYGACNGYGDAIDIESIIIKEVII